jgi:signal transduction histidine kinase
VAKPHEPDPGPKFERGLPLALFALLLGLVTLVFYAYTSLVSLNGQRIQVNEVDVQSLAIASELQYLQAEEGRLVLLLVLTGRPELRDRIRKSREDFVALTRRLEQVDPHPSTVERMRAVRKLKSDLVSHSQRYLHARAAGASRETTLRTLEMQGMPVATRLRTALADLFRHELRHFTVAKERVDTSADLLIRRLVLLSILTGAGFIFIIALLMRLALSKRMHDLYRERIHEEVQRTAEARKEALEVVSHDLKNPLSAVELNLQLVQRKEHGTSAPVSTALHAIQTMKELIQSLLDQARREAGTLELDLKPGSLLDLCHEAREVLEPLARQKRIQIEIHVRGEIPIVPFDHRRIGQVVSNILGNAIKFSPEGGSIAVRLAADDRFVRVSVSDSGKGIPKEELPRVFERFWQASATRAQGTGLGMAIAKGAIDAHGGRIWVESEPGKGATFHFVIPIARAAARSA